MLRYWSSLRCICLVVATDRGLRFVHEMPFANHIFNAIHSSTRMWGSSLNHNGMSAFIVTVPGNVELYFGGSTPDAVNGTEWLAFEPELSSWSVRKSASVLGASTARQQPLRDDNLKHGFLHTYRTKHDLRLLYLDGLSGSLSGLGTLDMQDTILLHGHDLGAVSSSRAGEDPYIGGTPNIEELLRIDYIRADRLCELAQDEWQGRVDGFLRSQWTSEIILCSFESHLTLERATWAPQLPYKEHTERVENVAEYKAVVRQFDGIGGERVGVDYQSFVTLFAVEDSLNFNTRGHPRARNESIVVNRTKRAIREMVLSPSNHESGTNWQAITDVIIARYSDLIGSLVASAPSSLIGTRVEIDVALRPFIDFKSRDRSLEIERCAMQHLPSDNNSTAAVAVRTVTTLLCDALFRITDLTELDEAAEIARNLQAWLGWTSWKRCRGCGFDEFCFVPMPPFGGTSDHANPHCISNLTDASTGYWDL